jgi:iron only hydrogenase large subunit-like protein
MIACATTNVRQPEQTNQPYLRPPNEPTNQPINPPTKVNSNAQIKLTMSNTTSVLLDSVDDYLAPSQACINPAFQPPTKEEADVVETKVEPKPKPAGVVPRRRRRVRRTLNTTATTTNGENEDDAALNDPTSTSTSTSTPAIAKKKEAADPVKASIADCLACSGCVTTAETVLLEQTHSLTSLRTKLETNGRPRAITLSPNSWADLCRHWELSPSLDMYAQFTTLLHQILRATIVVDGNLPLRWTWQDEAREFVELYRQEQQNGNTTKPPTTTPLPSTALDAERTMYYLPNGTSETKENSDESPPILPLISGACPALVCLVEKSLQLHHLVPHLSQSASPMSRMGVLLKNISKNNNDREDASQQWDHWAIMPCHDKKLEASRPDFKFSDKQTQTENVAAVDLVITTQELIELIEEWKAEQGLLGDVLVSTESTEYSSSMATYLQSLPAAEQCVLSEPSDFPKQVPTQPTLMTTQMDEHHSSATAATATSTQQPKLMGYSSGGHSTFIFHYAAQQLFGCDIDTVEWLPVSLVSTAVKSARLAKQQKQHSYQVSLYRHEDEDGIVATSYSQVPSKDCVLSFGIAHGMQTMQRALKQVVVVDGDDNANANTSAANPRKMQYLEAMACPYGCVNGGGQAARTVSASHVRETPTETKQRVYQTVERLQIPAVQAASTITMPPSSSSSHVPSTRHHVVPPMQYGMGAAAGVKVQDMLW